MRTTLGIILALLCVFALVFSYTSDDAQALHALNFIFIVSALFILYSCFILAFRRGNLRGMDEIFYKRVFNIAILSGIYSGAAFSFQVPIFVKSGGSLGEYSAQGAHIIFLVVGFLFGLISVLMFYLFISIGRKLTK